VLTSFFSKSKPINYLVVGFYMLILYVIAHFKKGIVYEILPIVLFFAGAILYILPMLLLNFVARKNNINDKGTYTILLYAFLTGLLPDALTNISILIASFLVMLGLQNLLYLSNGKYVKANIFNAAMYVSLASLAFFWSIAFLIPVFIGIWYFEPKNYRNWIIPLISLIMVYVLANCFTLVFYDSFFSVLQYADTISISFDQYLQKGQLFSTGIITICLLFFLVIYALKFGRKPANIKPILILIVVYIIIAIIVAIVAPTNDISALFFAAVPLSIIGATYFEIQFYEYAKEINIWVFILIPFVTLLF